MAQTYQPKDYVFSGASFVINANGANLSVTTVYPIVGEVLEIYWKFNRTGSLYLTESGTGRELFRRNAPSGAAGWQIAYPRIWGQDLIAGSVAVTIGSVANNVITPTMFPMVTAAPLIINISGAASGNQALDVMFRYR